jgi:hypothetical protein
VTNSAVRKTALLAGLLLCSCLRLNDQLPECGTPQAEPTKPCQPPSLARPDGSSSVDVPRPLGGDGPGAGGSSGRGGGGGNTAAADTGDGENPSTDPGCEPGFHVCAGACVDSKQVGHCGVGCDPCPAISGGEASCDATKCGVSCPAGKKMCAATNSCIGLDDACDGACPAGRNACNGLCVLPTEKTACGASCVACPTPANGNSACDGTQCILTCNPGFHRCGERCVDDKQVANCGISCSACPAPAGGSATCDGTSCGSSCPDGTKVCLGACIADNKPCDGQCPPGTHNCTNNCVSDTDVNSCGNSCMPCGAPSGGRASCTSGTCDFVCTTGQKCKGKCVSAENCSNGVDDDCDGQVDCADSQCGNGTTCGSGRSCHGGACVDNCTADKRCGEDTPCTIFRTVCTGGVESCKAMNKSGSCGTNMQCNNGTCAQVVELGQGCGADAVCRSGASCKAGVCCANGTRCLGKGAPCFQSTAKDCASGKCGDISQGTGAYCNGGGPDNAKTCVGPGDTEFCRPPGTCEWSGVCLPP